jgi:hypothetical protein
MERSGTKRERLRSADSPASLLDTAYSTAGRAKTRASRGAKVGLHSAAVLLSLTASAKRHRLNPWPYLTHVLTELPTRAAGADLTDLLPDRCASPASTTTPPN